MMMIVTQNLFMDTKSVCSEQSRNDVAIPSYSILNSACSLLSVFSNLLERPSLDA